MDLETTLFVVPMLVMVSILTLGLGLPALIVRFMSDASNR